MQCLVYPSNPHQQFRTEQEKERQHNTKTYRELLHLGLVACWILSIFARCLELIEKLLYNGARSFVLVSLYSIKRSKNCWEALLIFDSLVFKGT